MMARPDRHPLLVEDCGQVMGMDSFQSHRYHPAPIVRGWRSAPLAAAGKLGEFTSYAATLARHRIPVRTATAVIAAHGEDRLESVTVAKLDRDFETHACDTSMVNRHYAIGQDVGLRGTPAIVLEDGTLVSGYLPPLELTEALASLHP